MMKKLLVLLLVFGITSVANAGIIDIVIVSWGPGPEPVTGTIDPTKEITLSPSEWVDIDIIYSTTDDSAYLSMLGAQITLTGLAVMDLSVITEPAGVWDLDPTFSPGVTTNTAGYDYYLEYGEGMAGTGVPYPGGIAIDHILVHCEAYDPEGDNTVIVTLTNYQGPGTGGLGSVEFTGSGPVFPSFGDPITIVQIPEPMTIALLGLGGLFLLRRRR